MSWGRTVLAFGVVSLTFLRWYSEVGLWALVPALAAWAVGAACMVGQRRRYVRLSEGIVTERARPATASVIALCGAVAVLALTGAVVTFQMGG